MSIVDAANLERDCREIKRALEDIGCPVCDADTIKDLPDIIRKKCHHGPQQVLNAVIEPGAGIKVKQIPGKGYKISADDRAELTRDLSPELCAGLSVGKALFQIVNRIIPEGNKEAAVAPNIVDVDFIKSSYAGDDMYCNRFFAERGRGRKTGLRPDEWYLKITVVSQVEPIYVCMGALLLDVKEDIYKNTHRMCDNMIRRAFKEHGFDLKPGKPDTKPDLGCKDKHHHCHDYRPLTEEDLDNLWHHFDEDYNCDCGCDCNRDEDSEEPEIRFDRDMLPDISK